MLQDGRFRGLEMSQTGWRDGRRDAIRFSTKIEGETT